MDPITILATFAPFVVDLGKSLINRFIAGDTFKPANIDEYLKMRSIDLDFFKTMNDAGGTNPSYMWVEAVVRMMRPAVTLIVLGTWCWLETTEHSDGVSVVSGSRITVTNAGTYNLQFSAQLEKTTNGVNHVYIWFKKNGTNVPRSNTNIDVTKQAGGNGRTVAAWNYVDTLSANDYLEIVWQSDDTSMQLLAATATGNLPAIPSVIATLTQVS